MPDYQIKAIAGIIGIFTSVFVLIWCLVRHDKVVALTKKWIRMPNDY